ncbi:hypothetical protein R1sor_003043 [Riccia sorocarpa]|uniref:Uncharacterized protein n=1 Tax=Riccia sorocarpa TaxID=122646 RepID=A0ABD3H2L8_9MARC
MILWFLLLQGLALGPGVLTDGTVIKPVRSAGPFDEDHSPPLVPIPRLEEKVAIITGGAGGIGSAAAKLFASHGAYVIIADKNDTAGEKVVQQIGGRVLFKHCDVSKEADVALTVNYALEKFGKLDILFNNAGVASPLQTFQGLNMDDYDRCTAVNVRGIVLGIKHAARVMVPRRTGIILNTASIASVATGGTIKLIYNMNKANIPGITKVAAYHLGKHGIRVNCISPAGLATEMVVDWHKKFVQENIDRHTLEKAFLRCSPLNGRICTTEDIAKGALYLCSDESGYISGQNLIIDAGYTNIVDYDPMELRKKLKSASNSDSGSLSSATANTAESGNRDHQCFNPVVISKL